MIAKSCIRQLVYLEARLMDEHRYADWLALWDQGGTYWVPCNGAGENPDDELAIIYDDYARLQDRIARFESGTVLVQQPKSCMRRIVSNIEIDVNGNDATVLSNFILVEVRSGQQFLWAGQTTHRLRSVSDAIKIAYKKVILVNNDQELPPMQFLL